jgi:hypothetical protein
VGAIDDIHGYVGRWRGESRLLLHRPVEATYLSVMTAEIELAMQQQALLMRYAWQVEDEPQDGLFVLNQLDDVVAGYWFDSWHMADSSMAMTGAKSDGELSVRGSYPTSDGPDWGWRILLGPAANARLILRMFNITPEGDEELAVDADLARI